MEFIGNHRDRKVYYSDLENIDFSLLNQNWICFAISDEEFDINKFDKFIRNSIENSLLEFKAQGKYGELLHDIFDETIVQMEVLEGFSEIDICTTGNNQTDLANAFWECFYATALPEKADYENLSVLCINIDKQNSKSDLINFLNKFNDGWLPEGNDD